MGLSPEMPDPADSVTPYTEAADREFLARWREELLGRMWEALAKLEESTGQLLYTILHFRAANPDMASAQMAEVLGVRHEVQPQLLRGLPDGRRPQVGVAGLGAPAGEGHLARPGVLGVLGPPDEQHLDPAR